MSYEVLRAVARTVLVLVAALAWVGWAPQAGGTAAAASWSWPVTGVVTRPFAPPPHRYGAGHRGVDLLTAPGAPVRAAGAGRVSYAGLLAGRGVLVVVHGALRTTYEPVTAAVGLGTVVAEGEVLGRVEAGHAGCPALACLHWGLRRGEDYLDPPRLVEPGPVRLLPVGSGVSAARAPEVGGGVLRGSAVASAVVPREAASQEATQHASSAPAGPSRSTSRSSGPHEGAALTALGAGAVLAGAALRRRS